MRCIDKRTESQKITRGRFIIQEIIETSSNESSFCDSNISPLKLENTYKVPTKKRRNSQNSSKFKLNPIKENQISDSQFLVYDYKRKKYIDINNIFYKYEKKIPIHFPMYKSKRKISLIFEEKASKLNLQSDKTNQENENQCGILKQNEVKRIESIPNIAEHLTLETFESNNSINHTENQLQLTSTNNSNNEFIVQKEISYLIESQQFNECSIENCQFSLCGLNNKHNVDLEVVCI